MFSYLLQVDHPKRSFFYFLSFYVKYFLDSMVKIKVKKSIFLLYLVIN
ncbi:hypothetical protein EMIT0210MI2_90014 [Priestia megaterium]